MLLAWFVYAILGMLANLIQGTDGKPEPFDPKKLAKSFIWAIVVMLFAFALQIQPVTVATQYTDIINTLVTILLNSGAGMMLIYGFDRLYRILTGMFARFEVKT